MGELRPGKGYFSSPGLNHELLEFLHGAFEDLWNAAGDPADQDPEFPDIDTLQDSEQGMQYLKDIRSSATHWVPTQDKFGVKLHKALPWGTGEVRVTVVLKDNNLFVDIRQWYDPDDPSSSKSWSNK